MPDEKPAESSTAETPETASAAQAETTEQPNPSEASAASSSETQVETAPESEPGKTVSPDLGKKESARIKQLHREKKELERKLRQYEQPRTQAQEQRIELPKAPKQESFATYDEWAQAQDKYVQELADATARQAVQKDRIERERQRQQEEFQFRQAEAQKTFEKRLKETAKRNPDFADAETVREALETVRPNPTTDQFLLESEIGPDILAYLRDNPDEAEELREMPHWSATRHLLRLEDKLQDQIKGIQAQPGRRPPSYVTGGAAPRKEKPLENILYGD